MPYYFVKHQAERYLCVNYTNFAALVKYFIQIFHYMPVISLKTGIGVNKSCKVKHFGRGLVLVQALEQSVFVALGFDTL